MTQVDRFLAEWRARGRSNWTLILYRKVLTAYASWLAKDDLDLADLAPVTLAQYRQHLLGRHLRPKSVETYSNVLLVYARWLGWNGALVDWQERKLGRHRPVAAQSTAVLSDRLAQAARLLLSLVHWRLSWV